MISSAFLKSLKNENIQDDDEIEKFFKASRSCEIPQIFMPYSLKKIFL